MIYKSNSWVVNPHHLWRKLFLDKIIPNNNFKVTKCLLDDRHEGFFKQFSPIVGGNRDGKEGSQRRSQPAILNYSFICMGIFFFFSNGIFYLFWARTEIIRSRSPFQRYRDISNSSNSRCLRIARILGIV